MSQIDPTQIRAARAMMDWTRQELAALAGVSPDTIRNIEHGSHSPQEAKMNAIRRVFEEHGIEFTSDCGVRRNRDLIRIFEGPNSVLHVLDDVEEVLQGDPNAELLQRGWDDIRSTPEVEDRYDQLFRSGIRPRFLTANTDDFFVFPLETYRLLPKHCFSTSSCLKIYADRVVWSVPVAPEGHYKLIMVKDKIVADDHRKMFEYAWGQGKQPTKTTAPTERLRQLTKVTA